VHLWRPYKTQKISKTVVKQVPMSEIKAIKWPTTERQDNTKEEILKSL